jgi:hypothetical protein
VGLLVLSTVFLLTVAFGAAVARGVLGLAVRLVVHGGLPAASSIRIAAFLGALIAFWSLAPTIVESPAASGLMALVR